MLSAFPPLPAKLWITMYMQLNLTRNNLLNVTQHDLMPNRSPLMNLLCDHDLLSLVNDNQDANMFFFDLSKTFNAVDPLVPLVKLKAHLALPKVRRGVVFFLRTTLGIQIEILFPH